MVESRPPANPLFLRDEELRQGIELMFYAYRDFTFESDQQLRRYNLGRAHEELGQAAEARAAYERVISVDIGFQDTSARLAKL